MRKQSDDVDGHSVMVLAQPVGQLADRGAFIVRESFLKSYLWPVPTSAFQFRAALRTSISIIISTGLPNEARSVDLCKASIAGDAILSCLMASGVRDGNPAARSASRTLFATPPSATFWAERPRGVAPAAALARS